MAKSLCKGQKADKQTQAIIKEQLLAYFKQQAKFRKFYTL